MGFIDKRYYVGLAVFLLVVCGAGCAEINPFEVPGEVLNHPLGTESIKVGSTKEEVVREWGKPDIINYLGAQDETGTQREEWIYKARRITPVSIDAGYLSKNKYLYFDGNHLTLISNESKQK